MTAAVGVAMGLGRLGLALLSIALTWLTLAVVGRIEYGISARRTAKADESRKRKRHERVME
jgi:putative Mg2+ transporter-C (MgtC) family protein